MMDKQKFLPSKLFVVRAIGIVVLLFVAFGLYKGIPYFIKGFSKTQKRAELQKTLVKDLMNKDSNDNGIPDWEESLWGLDPAQDGSANKEFILSKRKSLGYTEEDTLLGENLTSSDKISRELLALIVSLKESGNLNDGAIASISSAFGSKIEVIEMDDLYKKESLNKVATNLASIRKYYNDFKAINLKYKDSDMGDELNFIVQGMRNNDENAMQIASEIAGSYKSFGEELSEIKVPDSLIDIHLGIINSYEKTANSIEEMSKAIDDQIAGLNAVISYKKYNQELLDNLDKLSLFFKKNGIIK